tara:strand:- start:40 stop:561 length:522 start_codon:yes stop_codon:yes gene_type:complete
MGRDTLGQYTLFNMEDKDLIKKGEHTKECIKCKKELPLYKMKKISSTGKHKDGIYKWYLGKKCKKCNMKETQEGVKNRSKFPYPKDKNYKCPICNKNSHTISNDKVIVDKDYNVYEGLLIRCFVLDHDHITGKVRGYICSGCNQAMGKMGDNIEGLDRAIKYLKGELNGSTGI